MPWPKAMSCAKTTTFLPTAALQVRGRGLDVLVGLAAGAERVLVDPRDRVGCRGARDEEDLVLVGERSDRERCARGDASGDDLVPLPDQVLGPGHGLGRVGAVVDERELDLAAVDLSGATGCVVQSQPQTGEILRAVGCERARSRVDDADLDRRVRARRRVRDPGGRAGACERRDPRDERCELVPPLHVSSIGRVRVNLRPDSGLLYVSERMRSSIASDRLD